MSKFEFELSEKERRQLEVYAEADGTELGELIAILLQTTFYADYFLSADSYKAVLDELRSQLKNYQDYSEIVERTETYTQTIRDLVWHI